MDTVRKQNTPICKRGKVSADIVTDSANEHSEFADADCRPFAKYDPQPADNIEPFANYDPQSADNIEPFANYDTQSADNIDRLQTMTLNLQTTQLSADDECAVCKLRH